MNNSNREIFLDEVDASNAPVCLFAYKRPNSLLEALNALAGCNGAKNTCLIVYIDGPKNESEKEMVQETYTVARQLDKAAFKSIEIISSDKNKGLAESVIAGVSETVNKYGTVIVLEDDLVPSIDFLDYMNASLRKYKDYEKIGSISGFGFLVKNYEKYSNYFHWRPTTWGWATWGSRWKMATWDLSKEEKISEPHFKARFNRGGQDLYRMLKNYQKGNIDSWGIRWAYNHYKNDWVASTPVYSMIMNNGYGNDGTNCNGKTPPPVEFNWNLKDHIHLRDDVVELPELCRQVDWYNSNFYKMIDRTRKCLSRLLSHITKNQSLKSGMSGGLEILATFFNRYMQAWPCCQAKKGFTDESIVQ